MTLPEGDPVYGLELASGARRQLARLPASVAPALVEFLTGVLLEQPWRVSKDLTGDFSSWRSARRGDYRVIFRIDAATQRVLVARIAHRSVVYRPPAP